MRLYLSSFGLGDEPAALAALTSGRRALVVMNALDAAPPSARGDWFTQQTRELARLGFSCEELDLRGRFASGRVDPGEPDLVWVCGGNLFVLRRAMSHSGFDAWLSAALRADRLAYGGFSAGAMVLSPSLRGAELVDDPNAVPEGYAPEIIWDGLGLVDFHIAPHVDSGHGESDAVAEEIAYFEAHAMPYHALRDGQALVVDDRGMRLVGDGSR